MPFDHEDTLPAAPDDVLAVLTDEVFLRDHVRALDARLEAIETSRDDGHRQVTVRLLAPTRGIPAVFARFVGPEVRVVDRRSWVTDGDGGHRADLDVRAEVFGRTARIEGQHRLVAAATGTRSTVTGEARVDAPLVGRQAEAAVRDLARAMVRREHELLRRWLGEPA